MAAILLTRFQSPLGSLLIGDYEGKLCMLDWEHRAKRPQIDQRLTQYLQASFEMQETALHHRVIQQILEYINGIRQSFDIPLLFAGTAFQQKVWTALMDIPFGTTTSYLALARSLGDEKAIRAVAAANGANAISIIVPCHRIIGSSGAMVGYAGGLRTKERLLQIEGAQHQGTLF